MKVIPSEISVRTPSAAEAKVFQLLRHVDLEDCFALHSLSLSEHAYKMCSEIDFLIVGPPGMFVLEVKGGRVARRAGVWNFTDRNGRTRRKAEGPFEQAQSAAFAVLERARSLAPAGALPRMVFGWAAVFPDQRFDESSVEWSPEMVIDKQDCATAAALESALRRLIRYWRAKEDRAKPLRLEEVDTLRRVLRPDFDLVPSLGVRGDQLDVEQTSLTAEQYKVLDLVDVNDRILCDGGAGTGKTFLAAETARREAAAGRRVLLTTRSSVLARFLARQPGLANDHCATVELSAAAATVPEPVDCVIVDEAQDIINLDDLVLIDQLLSGGLESGRWRMFYDSNSQTGVVGRFDPSALTLLDASAPARLHLRDNCRNTRDIVSQVQLVTGADVGVSTAGAGVPVEYTFWETEEEAAEQLSDHLVSLLDDGVDPHHITVLSPLPLEASCVRLLPRRLRSKLTPLDAVTVVRPARGIGFAAIRDFKGLENRFICVVDLTELDATTAMRNSLYVAMTRPRAGLWLGMRRDLRARLRSMRKDGAREREDGAN